MHSEEPTNSKNTAAKAIPHVKDRGSNLENIMPSFPFFDAIQTLSEQFDVLNLLLESWSTFPICKICIWFCSNTYEVRERERERGILA
jgi:hypothetical protein